MAVHIHSTKNDNNEIKINLMPCNIKFNGPANVSKYFKPNVKEVNDGLVVGSFRGHPLMGKELQLPANYTGHVLYEASTKMNEDTDRNIYDNGEFKFFTYWNYDKVPSCNDGPPNALSWINLAHVIHGSADAESPDDTTNNILK